MATLDRSVTAPECSVRRAKIILVRNREAPLGPWERRQRRPRQDLAWSRTAIYINLYSHAETLLTYGLRSHQAVPDLVCDRRDRAASR